MLLPGKMTKMIMNEAAKMKKVASKDIKDMLLLIGALSIISGFLFSVIPAAILIQAGMPRIPAAIIGFIIMTVLVFMVLFVSEVKRGGEKND